MARTNTDASVSIANKDKHEFLNNLPAVLEKARADGGIPAQ